MQWEVITLPSLSLLKVTGYFPGNDELSNHEFAFSGQNQKFKLKQLHYSTLVFFSLQLQEPVSDRAGKVTSSFLSFFFLIPLTVQKFP